MEDKIIIQNKLRTTANMIYIMKNFATFVWSEMLYQLELVLKRNHLLVIEVKILLPVGKMFFLQQT